MKRNIGVMITALAWIMPANAEQNEPFPVFDVEELCTKYYAHLASQAAMINRNACVAKEQQGYYLAKADWGAVQDNVRQKCIRIALGDRQAYKYNLLYYCIHPEAEMARFKKLEKEPQKFRY